MEPPLSGHSIPRYVLQINHGTSDESRTSTVAAIYETTDPEPLGTGSGSGFALVWSVPFTMAISWVPSIVSCSSSSETTWSSSLRWVLSSSVARASASPAGGRPPRRSRAAWPRRRAGW